MDRKQSVIANVKYQSSKGKGAAKLKGLLRYIQYRDDKDGHIPQHFGLERWVDKGLGGNFQTIAANCEEFKSEHVQAFTFVINPNPDLVAFIPEVRRKQFVQELTENTIESFFDARNMDTPIWSYCVHRRETTGNEDPGRDNPHAHIILPGTYESWSDGGHLPLYMNNRKSENHIEMLHEAAQQEIDILLQHYVGPDWEQRYDELHPIQKPPISEQSLDVEELPDPPDSTPHLIVHPSGEELKTWVAIQGDLDPDLYHVGFIVRGEGDQVRNQVFAAKAENLTEDQAHTLAEYMKLLIQDFPEDGLDRATYIARSVDQADVEKKSELLEMMRQISEPEMNQQQELDIDF